MCLPRAGAASLLETAPPCLSSDLGLTTHRPGLNVVSPTQVHRPGPCIPRRPRHLAALLAQQTCTPSHTGSAVHAVQQMASQPRTGKGRPRRRQSVKLGRGNFFSKFVNTDTNKAMSHTEIQEDRLLPQEHNALPVTEPKEMEICSLNDKELKMIV